METATEKGMEYDRQLANVHRLANDMDWNENQIAKLEEELKTFKAALRDIQFNQLPEAMTEIGIEEYTFEGRKIILDQETHSNITEKNRVEAFAWLKANGHGDILQYEFKIKVPKKLRELVNPIRNAMNLIIIKLSVAGAEAKLSFEEKVSYAGPTLIKLIKTLRAQGREVPEFIGTFDPLVAKWEKIDAVELE